MSKPAVLITGVEGEIGRGLLKHYASDNNYQVVTLDLTKSSNQERYPEVDFLQGNILDKDLIEQINQKYEIEMIFHLAAILSTGGEKNPIATHQVNVQGSINILELAKVQSDKQRKSVKVIFPSTIAVYGLLGAAPEERQTKTKESQFLQPITMYGMNKLYVEHLGRYFDGYFRYLDNDPSNIKIDFRSVRLPGVISAESIPGGGTSDYGPEMLHAAALGKPYGCFVKPGTRLPFMVMPDAVKALTDIALADRAGLSRKVYNVTSFSMTAEEIRQEAIALFGGEGAITYEIDEQRLRIVESWPGDVDDSAARDDWGWNPSYDQERAFKEYLSPGIRAQYENSTEKKIVNG